MSEASEAFGWKADVVDPWDWKVKVSYPWKLIELVRETPFDRRDSLFVTVAGKKGGQVDGIPHTEQRDDYNHERYKFQKVLKAESFAQEVQKILDDCSDGQLQNVIEKDKEKKVVGRPYTVVVETHFKGEIGRPKPEEE